jgi:hypothetical protein
VQFSVTITAYHPALSNLCLYLLQAVVAVYHAIYPGDLFFRIDVMKVQSGYMAFGTQLALERFLVFLEPRQLLGPVRIVPLYLEFFVPGVPALLCGTILFFG